MDRFIGTVVATADCVAGARRQPTKRINMSFDEWNVWYQTPAATHERRTSRGGEAPPLIEDIYRSRTRWSSARC